VCQVDYGGGLLTGEGVNTSGVPAYPGADSFVKAFDRLVLQERRRRGRVPVVLLCEPGTGTAGRRIVSGLLARLRGQDGVLTSHAYGARPGDADGEPLALFDDLVQQLVQTMPRDCGTLRLPRYRLMRAALSAPAFEGDAARQMTMLRKHCYDDHRHRARTAGILWYIGGQGDQSGHPLSMAWNAVAGPLFQRLPRALYGRRATRLMLGRRRAPRWLAQWYRAQHGSPPGDFFHASIGLVPGGPYHDEVTFDRVLSHALLADLDDACRRRLFRPWRRRRRTRFVLLLEEAGPRESRTQRLLRELRTASLDLGCTSVLVVAAGVRSVAGRIPDIETDSLADAGVRLAELAETGARPGEPTGMTVPVAGDGDDERARYWLDQHPRVLQPVPRFGPRTELAAYGGVLAVAGAALATSLTGVPFLDDGLDQRCQDQMFVGVDGTCVGVDVGSRGLGNGPSEKALKDVLHLIDRQNAAADRVAPGPRHRTVVYFGALSGGKGAEDPVRGGTLAGLRGVALAQRHVNEAAETGEHVPLRVIAADAGDRFKDAGKVARAIAGLARHKDPSIVGVVGFVQSRQRTFEAVRILDRAGIPMVGTSGTADALVDLGRHYYQLAPVDSRGAQAMARFAEHAEFVRTDGDPQDGDGEDDGDGKARTAERVELVYDPADPYSKGLGTAFRRFYGAARTGMLKYTPHDPPEPAHDPTGLSSLDDLAGRVCAAVRDEPRTALVWTGRSSQFTQFLRAFGEHSTDCPRLSVLAGDDVTNALIQDQHPWEQFGGLDLYYLSGGSAPLLKGNAEAAAFSAAYERQYGKDGAERGRALAYDVHAPISWDALHYLSEGVDAAWQATGGRRDGALGRTGVQTALYQGVGGFDGATGHIDSTGPHGRLTPGKLLFILRGHRDGRPTAQLQCGAVNARQTLARWGGDDGDRYPCPEAP
jgi:ABC-type branched-subunit amino acid transport system substrate-binding protein